MATAYIKELVNATSSEIVYPITKSQAVYMSDNSTTVQKAIEDLSALKNVPALDSQTSPNVSDLLTIFRNTNSTGYKALVSDVAKTIIESYQSSSLAGKTQSVKAALDSLNSSFMNLGTSGVYIPSNADLDTYRIPGIYDCNSGSVAATLEHCPVTTGFRLIVETTGYGFMAFGFQTILLGSAAASSIGGRVYRRVLSGASPATSTWGEWKELPTRSELDALEARVTALENK